MNEEKLPNWFGPWKEAGFIRPESAKRWMTYGFKPEVAAPWYDLDNVQIHIAAEWLRAGFTAADYVAWTRAGFLSPTTVYAWRRHFAEPGIAAQWRGSGLRIDGLYGELLDKGYPPEVVLHADLTNVGVDIDELLRWLDRMEDTSLLQTGKIQRWMTSGLSPEEVQFWLTRKASIDTVVSLRRRGWTVDEVGRLIEEWEDHLGHSISLNAHMTPEIALGWPDRQIPSPEAWNWARGLMTPDAAHAWISVGVRSHEEAKAWLKNGCGVDEVIELRTAGWYSVESFAPFRRRGWTGRDVLGFVRLGVVSSEMTAWISRHQMGRERWEKFFRHTYLRGSLTDWRSSGVPMASWPEWVDAVSGDAETCSRWFSTGLSPTEIAAKLKVAGCSAGDFDPSLSGAYLLNVLDSRIRGKSTSGRPSGSVPNRSRERTSQSAELLDPVLNDSISVAELEEYQARAVYLSGLIRKSPVVGMEFSDQNRGIRIQIQNIADVVTVAVELGGAVLIVRFDSDNFDPLSRTSSVKQKTAYILALSWFIDCAVSLRSGTTRMGSNFQQVPGVTAGGTNGRSATVTRYVPTVSFANALGEIASGRGVSPVLHHVSGHIRRLRPGWSPSEDAISRAPSFLRRRMGPRDTFVAGHLRGSEQDIEEYVVRLSKYSMTAHAFSEVLS